MRRRGSRAHRAVHDRGADRVGAHRQPADRVDALERPFGLEEVEEDVADERRRAMVERDPAQVEVVVGLAAGGQVTRPRTTASSSMRPSGCRRVSAGSVMAPSLLGPQGRPDPAEAGRSPHVRTATLTLAEAKAESGGEAQCEPPRLITRRSTSTGAPTSRSTTVKISSTIDATDRESSKWASMRTRQPSSDSERSMPVGCPPARRGTRAVALATRSFIPGARDSTPAMPATSCESRRAVRVTGSTSLGSSSPSAVASSPAGSSGSGLASSPAGSSGSDVASAPADSSGSSAASESDSPVRAAGA